MGQKNGPQQDQLTTELQKEFSENETYTILLMLFMLVAGAIAHFAFSVPIEGLLFPIHVGVGISSVVLGMLSTKHSDHSLLERTFKHGSAASTFWLAMAQLYGLLLLVPLDLLWRWINSEPDPAIETPQTQLLEGNTEARKAFETWQNLKFLGADPDLVHEAWETYVYWVNNDSPLPIALDTRDKLYAKAMADLEDVRARRLAHEQVESMLNDKAEE